MNPCVKSFTLTAVLRIDLIALFQSVCFLCDAFANRVACFVNMVV